MSEIRAALVLSIADDKDVSSQGQQWSSRWSRLWRKVRKIYRKKRYILMPCWFGNLEEVTLQSADQSDGWVREEP